MSFCGCCLQRSYAGRVVKQKKISLWLFSILCNLPVHFVLTIPLLHFCKLFPLALKLIRFLQCGLFFPRWKKVSRSFCNNQDSSFKMSFPPSLYSFILSSCTWTCSEPQSAANLRTAISHRQSWLLPWSSCTSFLYIVLHSFQFCYFFLQVFLARE